MLACWQSAKLEEYLPGSSRIDQTELVCVPCYRRTGSDLRSFVSLQTVFWNSCFARLPLSFVLQSGEMSHLRCLIIGMGVSSQSGSSRAIAFPRGSQSRISTENSSVWSPFCCQGTKPQTCFVCNDDCSGCQKHWESYYSYCCSALGKARPKR